MRFVETPVFTAAVRRHLADETYRALQLALLLRPTQGPIIQGGAGLRKLRWATEGRGKRGGVRLIYYLGAGNPDVLHVVSVRKERAGRPHNSSTQNVS